jgi:photosystem II stability/assembly factor-like uncharacterized protein
VSFFSVGTQLVNDGALYRSNDGGDSWTRVTATGLISPVDRIVFAPGHSDIMYAGTGAECHWCDGSGILRSRDGSQTWEQPVSELSGYRVLALAVHPDNPNILLAGVWIGSNDGLGIYRSADSGNSWRAVNGLTEHEELKVPDITFDPANPQIVYAATHGGLRVSFDGGVSWQAYPGPIGQLPITALTISRFGQQTYLYVGTVGGAVAVQPGELRTVQANEPQAAQANVFLGGGVYTRPLRWYSVYLPAVLHNP